MKILALLYACGFSSLLIGMDRDSAGTKLFGMIMILIAMEINAMLIFL